MLLRDSMMAVWVQGTSRWLPGGRGAAWRMGCCTCEKAVGSVWVQCVGLSVWGACRGFGTLLDCLLTSDSSWLAWDLSCCSFAARLRVNEAAGSRRKAAAQW